MPEDRWSELLQMIDKSEREPREKTAERLGPLAAPVFEVLDGSGRSDKLDQLVSDLAQRGLAEFVKVDLSIVRGLAYYTGVVFEAFDRAGKLRAIAGGGRYDNLIHQLSDGAVSLPAVGFAMGDVVLGELIRETPASFARLADLVSTQSAIDIYVVVAKEERRPDALARFATTARRRPSRRLSAHADESGQAIPNRRSNGRPGHLAFRRRMARGENENLASREEVLVPNEELLGRVKRLLSS